MCQRVENRLDKNFCKLVLFCREFSADHDGVFGFAWNRFFADLRPKNENEVRKPFLAHNSSCTQRILVLRASGRRSHQFLSFDTSYSIENAKLVVKVLKEHKPWTLIFAQNPWFLKNFVWNAPFLTCQDCSPWRVDAIRHLNHLLAPSRIHSGPT